MMTALEIYWRNELFRLGFISALLMLGAALYWLERLIIGMAESGYGLSVVVTGSMG